MSFWEKIIDGVIDGITTAITTIAEALAEIWDAIKSFAEWVYEQIFSFNKYIYYFFFGLRNEGKIKDTQIAIGIEVQKLMKSGDVSYVDIGLTKPAILTTLLDKETGEIDIENARVVEYERLDEKTKDAFKDKSIIVLK